MLQTLVTAIIGIAGGLAVGMQSGLAGAMSQRVGGSASSFVIHVSGALLSGALLLLRGGEQIGNWRSLSWLMLGSGGFGVILYLTLSHTLPRLGATAAIALIILGQLTMGMVIDHFGLFGVTVHPVDAGRVLAIVLLLGGGYLMLR